MNNAYTLRTVAELVTEQPARAAVFEKWRIDYCCGGKRLLADVCGLKGIDLVQVAQDLAACDEKAPAEEKDWAKESLTDLCDHIEGVHHAYLREALPRLSMLTQKVARRHGDSDPRLKDLAQVFAELHEELASHMMKEERVLFPMVRSMEAGSRTAGAHCGGVQNPIRVMVAEHDDAGEALEEMSRLTDGFVIPPAACNSYRAMLFTLAELERDLHIHIHKENHILFPRAAELEAQLV